MAQIEQIRDYQTALVIGELETLPNGDIQARAIPSRMIVGYYRKSQDVTTDFYGRRIAKGNCVAGLIFQNKK